MAKKNKDKKRLSDWQKLVSKVHISEGVSVPEAAKIAKPLYKKGITASTYKKGSSGKKSDKKRSSTKRGNPMAKKNKNKKRRKFTIPMTIVVPIAATPFIPGSATESGWESPYEDAKKQNAAVAMANYATGWTGINFRAIQEGHGFKLTVPSYLLATGLGVVFHKIASILGVNRALAAAKVPVIRV